VGLLSVAATHPQGFDTLARNWQIAEETAAEHGTTMQRSAWRVVVPMHLAETREQASEDVGFGILKLVRYMEGVSGQTFRFGGSVEAALERWRTHGFGVLGVGVIGTPDDAIVKIDELIRQTGGFGTLLLLCHDAASPEATAKSYELFARHVAPHFRAENRNRTASLSWANHNAGRFMTRTAEAVQAAFDNYDKQQSSKGH
jgi:limonene 1,2-monooxygenase